MGVLSVPHSMCTLISTYIGQHNAIESRNILQDRKGLLPTEVSLSPLNGGDKWNRTADLLNAMFACREHDA